MDNLSLLNLIILGLATWRVSSLLVNESGPFGIFIKIREVTGIQHDKNGDAYLIPDNVFAQILSCVWCCSVWVAFFWEIIYLVLPQSIVAALPFALSAIAVVVQSVVHKDV